MSVKTKIGEISNSAYIGKPENPIKLNEVLVKANLENLSPAVKDTAKTLLLVIDMQNDFMEGGSLPVTGSLKDVGNLCYFIYENITSITRIVTSLDTHGVFQIFHPCWWEDTNGKNPNPFTLITLKDLNDGKWMPVMYPKQSRDYVENLEKLGNKNLMIWPYHCLQGTYGNAIENQLSNMIKFFEVARKSSVMNLVKGNDPLSEMYGIIKPEYSVKNYVNIDFLNYLKDYDRIIIAGEASDYCVYESLRQIIEFYANKPDVLSKMSIIEDCTSSVSGKGNDEIYKDFKNRYGIKFIKSTDKI